MEPPLPPSRGGSSTAPWRTVPRLNLAVINAPQIRPPLPVTSPRGDPGGSPGEPLSGASSGRSITQGRSPICSPGRPQSPASSNNENVFQSLSSFRVSRMASEADLSRVPSRERGAGSGRGSNANSGLGLEEDMTHSRTTAAGRGHLTPGRDSGSMAEGTDEAAATILELWDRHRAQEDSMQQPGRSSLLCSDDTEEPQGSGSEQQRSTMMEHMSGEAGVVT